MKNLKKLSRENLANVKGSEATACYCTGDSGTTFMDYTANAEGCYYACTKSLSLQPQQ